MSEQQPYTRPPITEAVIQIAFGTAIDSSDTNKANRAFTRFYPNHQETRNIDLEFGVPPRSDTAAPTAQIRHEEIGHRRSADDQAQILILWPSSFVISQLAPYPGWDQFFGRFVRDWELWKNVIGYQKIGRIGVRYVNRIDIPITSEVTEYEHFINVYPYLPQQLGPLLAYGIQVQLPITEMLCTLVINAASVPSPLLGHASFVFDQDISRYIDIPQNDEGLYSLLTDIHVKKNAVFEACITDRARELFRT